MNINKAFFMKTFFKGSILFFTAFFLNTHAGIFITEVINNTDELLTIRPNPTDKRVGVLVTESLTTGKEVEQVIDVYVAGVHQKYNANISTIYFTPRTKSIVQNLFIPSVDVNFFDPVQFDNRDDLINRDDRKGMNFDFANKGTADYKNPNWFIRPGCSFLTLKKVGDLLAFFTYSSSIKNFNFFGVDIAGQSAHERLEGIVGEMVNDGSTYTIEINQIHRPGLLRKGGASCSAYGKDAINIVFRKNNISSELVKSKLVQIYPCASILSFSPASISQGATTAVITFNKAVTHSFFAKFYEYLRGTELGKFLSIEQLHENGQRLLSCKFYTKITRQDIQRILNQANNLRLPQYDF